MINFINGGRASDNRGSIRFVNEFDMTPVKRFYIIKNADTELIRGWRAHKLEQRWFYVLSGAFSIDFVKIDNWDAPSTDLPIQREMLEASEGRVVHIPTGYGTAVKALEANSELLVFADFGIEHAKEDDHTYPLDYFINRIS